MYGSVRVTTIQNRPTNEFDDLPDCFQTKESGNYRPTVVRARKLARFCRPIGYFAPSLKGIVIRFLVMALSNVALSLLVETLIVNF
jgi:hypothetical protein